VDRRNVTTVEGLVGKDGPDVVQDCFDESGCLQCGFCQPGMIMAARQLVTEHPDATRQQIKQALASNLCRCTGYTKIYEAVEHACRRTLERQGRGAPGEAPGRRSAAAATRD
jgi:carbon-monoxide dehydrogenase small subunit